MPDSKNKSDIDWLVFRHGPPNSNEKMAIKVLIAFVLLFGAVIVLANIYL